jgi:hypothetical protein
MSKVPLGFLLGLTVPSLLAMMLSPFIPWAMSLFGTVVSGVGTIHQAGGVAATLQATTTALVKPAAALVGGAVGGVASLANSALQKKFDQ